MPKSVTEYSKVSLRFRTGSTGRVMRGYWGSQVVANYFSNNPHINM
jgi:hypothetical protein